MREWVIKLLLLTLVLCATMAAYANPPPKVGCFKLCQMAHQVCSGGCANGDGACHRRCAAEQKACKALCRGGGGGPPPPPEGR
jgi:hypothetical protein